MGHFQFGCAGFVFSIIGVSIQFFPFRSNNLYPLFDRRPLESDNPKPVNVLSLFSRALRFRTDSGGDSVLVVVEIPVNQ